MKKGLIIFIKIVDTMSEWTGRAVSILVPAMVMVIGYEVVARYFFSRPTIWVYDTAIFFFGYCGLLAGAYALRRNEHISVDVIYSRFSERGKAVLDAISGLLFLFFLCLVMIYGWKAAATAIQMGERTNTEWAPSIGHFKLVLPVAASMLLLQQLVNWIRSLYRAFTGKELKS